MCLGRKGMNCTCIGERKKRESNMLGLRERKNMKIKCTWISKMNGRLCVFG